MDPPHQVDPRHLSSSASSAKTSSSSPLAESSDVSRETSRRERDVRGFASRGSTELVCNQDPPSPPAHPRRRRDQIRVRWPRNDLFGTLKAMPPAPSRKVAQRRGQHPRSTQTGVRPPSQSARDAHSDGAPTERGPRSAREQAHADWRLHAHRPGEGTSIPVHSTRPPRQDAYSAASPSAGFT